MDGLIRVPWDGIAALPQSELAERCAHAYTCLHAVAAGRDSYAARLDDARAALAAAVRFVALHGSRGCHGDGC